jgi:hypothetical protein
MFNNMYASCTSNIQQNNKMNKFATGAVIYKVLSKYTSKITGSARTKTNIYMISFVKNKTSR